MSERAQRNSWEIAPMPGDTIELPYVREFSLEEYHHLSCGLIPREMEDKWFIFLEEDCLYFHLSWTGVCIYKVQLKPVEQRYVVAMALMNGEAQKGRWQSSDHKARAGYNAALLNFLVENLLLGNHIPFPVLDDQPENAPPGLYQHLFSGTGYRETKFRKG